MYLSLTECPSCEEERSKIERAYDVYSGEEITREREIFAETWKTIYFVSQRSVLPPSSYSLCRHFSHATLCYFCVFPSPRPGIRHAACSRNEGLVKKVHGRKKTHFLHAVHTPTSATPVCASPPHSHLSHRHTISSPVRQDFPEMPVHRDIHVHTLSRCDRECEGC